MLALALTGKPPRNIAPSLGAVLMGRIRGSGCRAANPDGIKALVEDAEGSEEAASRDGKKRVRDVVDLGVVNVLVDGSAIRSATGGTLELPLEFGA